MQTINTLHDGAGGLPDLDEYEGMSIVDIAHNIINWPEDSEEQRRAILALQSRSPGLGHNRPPLDEQLTIELEGYRGEVDALIDIAEKSLIVDETSAAKVNDLLRMLIEKGGPKGVIDTARSARLKPYRDAAELINSRYNALITACGVVANGADGKGGLRDMLTKWDDKKRAIAAAEQAKALAEQKARDDAAAEALAKAEAAREQGDHASAVTADLHAASLADQAARAGIRAHAIRPQPIRSNLGTTSRTKRIVFTVDNSAAAITWALKQPGLGATVLEDFKKRIEQHLRSASIGVKGVERGVAIPGISARIELGPISSRR